MVFYEVELQSIPVFLYACNTDFTDYKNRFPTFPNLLEYSLCYEGRILFEYPDETTAVATPGMFIPICKDLACKTSAYQKERQKHASIGVQALYDLVKWDSDREIDLSALRERVVQNGHILFPFLEDIGEAQSVVKEKMQRIIYLYSSTRPSDLTNALGEWFSLSGYMTAFVLQKLGIVSTSHAPSAERYVRKAEMYVQANYTQKISIEDVAHYLGISSGYLSRVFKEVKGITVLEYLNRYRIDMLSQLFVRCNCSLKDASYSVGFDDPSYASRVFKKVTGISFRQFCAQQNEKAVTGSHWLGR